jgi:hypothetical protein
LANLYPRFGGGRCNQRRIQITTTHPNPKRPIRKLALRQVGQNAISNAAKGLPLHLDPQSSKCGHTVGHQALAARLLARKLPAIHQNAPVPLASQTKGSSAASDSGSHDDDVCVQRHAHLNVLGPVFSRSLQCLRH